MGRAYSTNGGKGNAYRILVAKALGRPRLRWVDNIQMDRREMRLGGLDWIDLAEDRDRWRTRQ
jgi:hypothetical protein